MMQVISGSARRRRRGTKADERRLAALSVTLNHWTFATWLHEAETLDQHVMRRHPWATKGDMVQAIEQAIAINNGQIQYDTAHLSGEWEGQVRQLRVEMIELAKKRNKALIALRKTLAPHLSVVSV